jgi:hypothetical protein
MKNDLVALIEKVGLKHYARSLTKRADLHAWVMEQTKHLTPDPTLPERVYYILNGDHRICQYGNPKIFNTLDKGYRFCSASCRCRREEQARKMLNHHAELPPEERERRVEKQRETLKEIHGVENPMDLPGVKEKIKTTNRKRYGGDHHMVSEEVRTKIRNTNLERRGVAHPAQDPEVMAKVRATNLERYGTTHTMDRAREAFATAHGGLNPFQVPEIEAKRAATMLARYGVSRALCNPEIMARMTASFQAKHDATNPMKIPEVREKLRRNYQEKFGVNSASQRHIPPAILAILADREQFDAAREGKSLRETSIHLGVSYTTIQRAYERFGIPIPRSSYEDELLGWLQNKGFAVKSADRMAIKPFELDLLIEEKKVAIEFCGLYWHGETFKMDPLYHLNKVEEAENAGYRLVTIFEDELVDHRHVVYSRLAAILGIGERGIGARSATVKPVKSQEAYDFFERFHVQGGVYGSHQYGAFDGDEMIACMSFSKPRVALGRKEGSMELLRYATDGRMHPGIASRLFKAFLRDVDPSSVMSYADRRWSDGGLYRALGFTELRPTAPNYWYVHPSRIKRYHRFNFRKDALIREYPEMADMTERAIMTELGYYRIWDCGHFRFVWNKP